MLFHFAGLLPRGYHHSMHALFITGTDTSVGKTHTACVIARQAASAGWRVGAYKPACSGAIHDSRGQTIWEDLERLSAAINVPAAIDDICPQRFLAPLAPPIAARTEQRPVNEPLLQAGGEVWRHRVDLLLIEGAGGLLCPLTDNSTMAELARSFGVPVLIVARPGLGTINHTLMTIEVARQRSLQIAGVIFCETSPQPDDASRVNNGEEITRRSGVPILGTIPFENTTELYHQGHVVSVDWYQLAQPMTARTPSKFEVGFRNELE